MNRLQGFVNDALKTEIRAVLARCTEAQVVGFDRFFPKGVDALDDEKLHDCLLLCWRTDDLNNKHQAIWPEEGEGE